MSAITIITNVGLGKTEIIMKEHKQNSGEKEAKKRHKLYWLLIDLVVLAVVISLLFYRPAGYKTPRLAADEKVSKYLTHQLLPQLYNGAQQGRPYELIVSEQGINDIIAHSDWPKQAGGASFYAPTVSFCPPNIIIMSVVMLQGVEFVVTIVLKPSIDQQGLLNLDIRKVKVGALNVTPIAKMIAGKMYRQQLAAAPVDKDDIRAKIAASLFNSEPFEPILNIKPALGARQIKVRIEKVDIEPEKLTLHLVPLQP